MGTSRTYRRKITVDHTQVSNQDLTDFPLLIVLEDRALKAVSQGGHVAGEEGEDILSEPTASGWTARSSTTTPPQGR